ncbi:hypothetical protein B5S29_g5287 [[Candida] boidinii]|nr:hypothetical protein B5S29_g5287 [[Candida] boidinii]
MADRSIDGSVLNTGPPTSENFELWIRMATDNKINSSNSWNFALIDYFHDLSLLRDGDSINFQKASTTLDGCVKIYASRIDSAASETGRLLSGLSSSKFNHNDEHENEDGENEDEDEEGEEGDSKSKEAKNKKRKRSRNENTLFKGFDQVRIKEVDRELFVDPIFKKALSDFDEGGAKSLLNNMLHINSDGRIVFDTTERSSRSILEIEQFGGNDDSEEANPETDNKNGKEVNTDNILGELEDDENDKEKENDEDGDEDEDNMEVDEEEKGKEEGEGDEESMDLAKLYRYFDDRFVDSKVCPSLEQLERITNEGASATELLEQVGAIDIDTEPIFHHDDNFDYDYNDDMGDNYNDMGMDEDSNNNNNLIGIGGEDDEARNRTHYSMLLDAETEGNDSNASGPNLTLTRLFDESFVNKTIDEDDDQDEQGGVEIADYFDSLSRKNWRGPEHWKISRIKRMLKQSNNDNDDFIHNNISGNVNKNNVDGNDELEGVEVDGDGLQIKKKKERITIDFINTPYPKFKRKFGSDDEDDEDEAEAEIDAFDEEEEKLFEPSNRILLPQSQWNSESHYLLPEDLQFTTKRLIFLNFKPEQKIKTILTKRKRRLLVQKSAEDYEREDQMAKMTSNTIADENFFADNYGDDGYGDKNNQNGSGNGNGDGDDQFNDNFFNDNDDYGALGYSDDDDGDTDGDSVSGRRSNRNDILSQNRGRGRGINFARVAKKVNVKLLKDNLWDSLQEVKNRKEDEVEKEINPDIGGNDEENKENKELSDNDQNINENDNINNNGNDNDDKVMNELGKIINDSNNTKQLKFTEVVDNMSIKYSREEKSELSTSFCFICLLHLANENGFKIESNKDNTDLFIV